MTAVMPANTRRVNNRHMLATPTRLSELPVGALGAVHELRVSEREALVLGAMGLRPSSRFRV